MVPCERRQRRAGGGLGWNPLAPLLSCLADGQQLCKSVQERAAALGKAAGGGAGRKGVSSASAGSSSSSVSGPDAPHGSHASPGASSSASSAAPPAQPEQAEQRYCLEDVPVRHILAGGVPPQLAWVPLRVALAMLHDLPQHFMLLQGAVQGPKQQRNKQRQQQQQGGAAEGRQKGRQGQHAQQGSAAQQPTTLATVTSPAGLDVYVLPVSQGLGCCMVSCTCSLGHPGSCKQHFGPMLPMHGSFSCCLPLPCGPL